MYLKIPYKLPALVIALTLALGTSAMAETQHAPADISKEATTTSYYLSKAVEGIGAGISSGVSSVANGFSFITSGFSVAGENLSLAGNTLAGEIRDSVVGTAKSIKKETTSLALKTKDAAVTEAGFVRTGAVTLATGTRDIVVAFKNAYVENALALASNASSAVENIIPSISFPRPLAQSASMSPGPSPLAAGTTGTIRATGVSA